MVAQDCKAVSPYGVAATSVAPLVELTTEPLTPFEQQALKYLQTAYSAYPKRVQEAFLAALTAPLN
jgi:hypothetical protein